MTLAQLFKDYRVKRGYTQKELADIIKQMPNCEAFSPQNYAAIESGKTQRTGFVLEIAKALNIPLEILSNLPRAEAAVDLSYGWKIPVFNEQSIELFYGGDKATIPDNYIILDENDPTGQIAGLAVKGIIMAPEFNQGDIAIIDAKCQPKNGDYVFAKLKDTVGIRQFQQEGQQQYLIITNPLFQEHAVKVDDKITIFGTVTKKIKYYK